MSNYPDDMNWAAYDAMYRDWKPTRDEAREEITKIAEKYAPLIQAEIAKLFIGFGVDNAALTFGKSTFVDCLDEMLCEGAYEDLNAIEDDAE